MKAKYIALAAAAAAILAFSGCGDTAEGGAADSLAKVEAGAAESAADVGAAAPAGTDEAAPAADAPAAATSEAGDATPTLTDSTDVTSVSEADSTTESTATAPGDYVFTTPNGDYTFEALNSDGLANTADGKWYVLVPSDGGAGHMYYQTYYSTNGTDWTKGNVYDETNGNNYHYALPDGRILLFNTQGPIASNVPIVSAISIGGDNNVSSAKVENFFKDQYLDDGSVLDQTEGLMFYVTYNGGYNFTFSFTNTAGVIVYNVRTDLDEGTLLMKE